MTDFVETLWQEFAAESDEHLTVLEPLLVRLGTAEGEVGDVARVFRGFHSLKGLSRAMSLHGMEAGRPPHRKPARAGARRRRGNDRADARRTARGSRLPEGPARTPRSERAPTARRRPHCCSGWTRCSRRRGGSDAAWHEPAAARGGAPPASATTRCSASSPSCCRHACRSSPAPSIPMRADAHRPHRHARLAGARRRGDGVRPGRRDSGRPEGIPRRASSCRSISAARARGRPSRIAQVRLAARLLNEVMGRRCRGGRG